MTSNDSPLPRKAHWPPAYIYLQTIAIALVVWYYSRGFYVDDSYISLRYSRNLLDGNGLSWNPGERVEGYSNFLFVILTAALGWFGVDLVLASRIIDFTAFFLLVGVVALYTRQYPPRFYADHVCRALCISLVASSVPILVWCFGGLESDLYALFITAGVCLVLNLLHGKRENYYAPAIGLCFALAALTRPDGAIFTLFTLGFLGLVWLWPQTRRQMKLKDILCIALVFAVIYVPYFAWRVWYFGDWAPNTYYAKVYGIDLSIILGLGVGYAISFLMTPPLLVIMAAVMFTIVARRRLVTLPMLYLAGFTLLYIAYLITIGGDYMPYDRFIVALIPVLALLIYHAGLAMMPFREKKFRDFTAVLLALSIFQFFTMNVDQDKTFGVLSGMAVKDYIAKYWPDGSLIALNCAGVLPYLEPQYRYLDMLGLNDRHIAHRKITKEILKSQWPHPGHIKTDGVYILARRPDYIILCHSWGCDEPAFLSDREVFDNPDLKRYYDKVEVYITPPPELLPSLEKVSAMGLTKVNDQHQLRFIYYKKKRP